MASTYSTNLKIELIGTGEQSGTWGNTTNTNLGSLIEEAIAGYVTQAVTDGAATVLTIPNGSSSNGRNYVIELTGTLTANRTVEVPAVDKPYIFFNNTTGGYSVTAKVSGQTGVTIANGKKAIVYTNSTDVIEVVNAPVSEAGTQTLTNKTLTNPTINGFTGNTAVINVGSGQIYKDTSGNVGIGTTSPSAKLDVTSSGANTIKSTSSGSFAAFQRSAPTGQQTYDFYTINGVEVARITGDPSYIAFGTGSSATERMRIDSSGNVGIGTSSPAQKLDVKGIQQFTNSATPANTSYIYDGGGLLLSSNNSNPMYFYTGASERMRIDSSGNLLVGTTTSPSTSGIGLGSGLAVTFSYSGYSSFRNNMYLGALYWNNGTDRLTLDASGNLTASGNVTAYSDARLKKNVTTIDKALDLVEKMRGVRYERIDSGASGIGVIAQEMQEVVPEVVLEGENLSVAYGNLVGVLIEAVKELSARVKELEAK